MRTSDHLFTDPHADELMLRHRIHSTTSNASQTSVTSPSKRPALGVIYSAACLLTNNIIQLLLSAASAQESYINGRHCRIHTIALVFN